MTEGVYLGCYNDRKLNSSRLLPVFLAYNKQFVTPLRCASLARAAGLKLYGVQFRGQCYGGNDLVLATSLGTSAACTMNCTGDNSQICGGPWSNSLYSLIASQELGHRTRPFGRCSSWPLKKPPEMLVDTLSTYL
ncbi:hypothetical protein VOLCADRAFT_88158 [Volvox carteri f. nagariensis]|uniref:WSC domain-containing protein n=1 Tax=Volvox carteri f. nagariensis TaxID=3068 RepID=D8TNF4_VOLCA|nr:uncharacterized protein VOLCADRAFT_88158 [Volvox carteri f. nagariensis]EFJ50832.1 hypothetical protein VOLCADRAFT_88158 [Volvox carteri f. nagariensis]|eukprot:XP_002947844.1 hypothetical protein VOLCADRAFT_88158 [Volvox carteri f. nagariensis]